MAAKKTTPKSEASRRHIRFSPDPGAYAKLDLSSKRQTFSPTVIGLIAEEAFGGCGLVVINTPDLKDKLKVGDKLRVQVGRLDPLIAEVKWRVDLDIKVVRLGLMYCD